MPQKNPKETKTGKKTPEHWKKPWSRKQFRTIRVNQNDQFSPFFVGYPLKSPSPGLKTHGILVAHYTCQEQLQAKHLCLFLKIGLLFARRSRPGHVLLQVVLGRLRRLVGDFFLQPGPGTFFLKVAVAQGFFLRPTPFRPWIRKILRLEVSKQMTPPFKWLAIFRNFPCVSKNKLWVTSKSEGFVGLHTLWSWLFEDLTIPNQIFFVKFKFENETWHDNASTAFSCWTTSF